LVATLLVAGAPILAEAASAGTAEVDGDTVFEPV
jgi:hypothetical protein